MKMSVSIFLPLLLLVACSNLGLCFFGNPITDATCLSMLPVAGGDRQTSPSPFAINIVGEGSTFKAWDIIPLTITSTDGRPFQSILLEARIEYYDLSLKAVGDFCDKGLAEQGLKQEHCGETGKDNVVTTVDQTDKQLPVTIYFHADPAKGITNNIYFRATVMSNATAFWTQINSNTLTISTDQTDFPDAITDCHAHDPDGSESKLRLRHT